MISMIAAVAADNSIGRNGQLPWHISADLKRFKEITTGHTIIMGRKTFESFPRPLPKRFHIVLSRNTDYEVDHPRVKVLHSTEECLKEAAAAEEEIFVIGGAQLYKQALPYAEKLYLTLVDTTVPDADAHFPYVMPGPEWKLTQTSEAYTDEESGLSYRFVTLERRH